MAELKPGYYWYRDYGEEWQIVKVIGDEGLVLVVGNDLPFGLIAFQGQWGPRLENPA